MKRLICIQLSLFIFAAAAALGAEPPTAPKKPGARIAVGKQLLPAETLLAHVDPVTEPIIPKREIQYETTTEPREIPAVDAALFLEQHYVAEFTVDIPEPIGSGGLGGDGKGFEIEGAPQAASLLAAFWGSEKRMRKLPGSLGGIPEGHRPPKEFADLLVPPFLQEVPKQLGGQGGGIISYQIFAPTPARAKELVGALLSVYDYGLSYPEQKAYIGRIKTVADSLAQARQRLEKRKAEVDLPGLNKQIEDLDNYKDVDAKSLPTYIAQRRTIDVDTAGTKARLDACNKILEQRKDLPTSRIEQVETVKVTAEIELAGQEAKRLAIARIIENGEKRLALLARRKDDAASIEALANDVRHWEQTINGLAETRHAWESGPIEGGKVVIRPIKWRPADPK